MFNDTCVQVTGFGFAPTFKTFEDWVREDIQDWEAAYNVAHAMIEAYPQSYPWNEADPPEYYMEFDISNLDAFKQQMEGIS